MAFLDDDFLLSTPAARRLYHEYAAPEPIFDYHCHLSPRDLAENRQFKNLHEIWLEGDHYKWRALRANGVAEKYITGDATPWEKFQAWARTVPQTLRNPLYHWTHLELLRYFGIDKLLSESTAERIWTQANEQLATPALTTHGILRKFRVKVVCTTDDPADDLQHHAAIAKAGLETQILPAFRPDNALQVHRPEAWNAWLDRLEQADGREVRTLPALLEALRRRCEYFHAHGCRLSDHGLERCFAETCTEAEAGRIFAAARAGTAAGSRGAGAVRWFPDALSRARSTRRKGGRCSFTSGRCATTTRASCATLDRIPALTPSATFPRAPRFLLSSIASTRATRCRGPSSIISTRPTIISLPG